MTSVPITTFFTKRTSPDKEFKLNASCNNNLSFIPIFLCNKIISPDIIVTTPSPPIWISKRITTCPKTLHDETVGITTNPVTQVAVVAVNKASQKEAALPCAELIGNDRKNVPVKIVSRKPIIIIICVVVNENLFFIIAPINLCSRLLRVGQIHLVHSNFDLDMFLALKFGQ